MKSHTLKSLISLSALLCAFVSSFADPDIFTVSCSNGNVFTISRTDASAASWVDYYTQSGSAVAGVHYEDMTGRLDFAKGESSKIVTVPLYSVSSADKYYIDSDYYRRYFNFCVHNNSMTATQRATGTWNIGTYITADNISSTRQQKICDDFKINGSNQSNFADREFMCSSTIGDAFTAAEKEYYVLTDQTLKYDFNVQLTYNIRYYNYYRDEALGVTLDGYSSVIAKSKYSSNDPYHPYVFDEIYTPSGIGENLCNNTFEYRYNYSSDYATYISPNGNSLINEDYKKHYLNGWFVDMDPTKHIGIRIMSQGADLSNIVANVRMQDKIAPVITNTYVNVNHIYTSGERVYVAVRFNEPVTGSVSSATVSIGSREFTFYYSDGLNTNTLYFYSDLSTTSASGICGTVKVTAIDGTITDACGNAGSYSSILANNSCPNFQMYPTYSVTLHPNGGTIVDGNFARYTYSVGAALPNHIEKTGFNFDGWFTNEDFVGSPVTTIYPTESGNKTYYAKWSPKTFDVTLDGNGVDIPSDINVTSYTYGTAVQLPVLEKAGYTFYGWYDNPELTGSPVTAISSTEMGERTFHAKWTTNTYFIAYNPAGADGESPSMANTVCTYNESVALSTNVYTRTGYEFLGWATAALASSITYTDGQSVKNLTAVNGETVDLFAVWKPNTYTITFEQGTPTTLGTPSIEATYDSPLQVVICPDSVGYAFEGYFTEGGEQYYTTEGKSAIARYKNTSDLTLYARWTVRDYIISFVNNGGTITTADYAKTYNYGSTIVLPEISKDGNEFGGWFDNPNCTGTAVTKIASSEYGDKTFYAKWNPITYTVTLHENGGEIVNGKVVNYTFGVGAILPTHNNMEWEGHFFAGWFANEDFSGDAVSAISVAEFGNKEYWAKWDENGYFVTLQTNGGIIQSGNVVSYKYGTGAVLPTNLTKTGYDFAGWYDNSSFIGSAFTEITDTDLGDKNYWAKWKEQVYSITFNTKGGDINNVAIENYTYTVGVVLPADVTLKGHTFKGWYDNEACSGNPVTLISTTDFGEKEFWADWTENKYSISYIANGGIINDNYVEEYTYGASEITLPQDVTKSGYTFGGWYTNDSYTSSEVKVITVTDLGNKTFYAKWNVNTYNVTLVANGGTINSGNIANYTYGYGVTLTSDITQNGFTFAGWYADEKFETARLTRISETKTGDLTLYAKWTKNNYLITLNVNEGSIDEDYVSIYTFGEGTTLPTNVSRKGYTFKGWYTNSNFDGSAIRTVSATEYGNKTFWAKWLVNTYKVTFDAKGGVIHSGGFDSYIYGVGASLPTNVTKTGYTFDGWYLDEDCNIASSSVISVNETGDKTFYAKWNVNTYNVIFVTNEGVINSGNVESYEFGKGATLPTDVTKEGYSFGGWYSNSSYIGGSVSSIANNDMGDKQFWAKWIINEYEVNVEAEHGSVTGADYYEYKSPATLKAVPNEGYEFVGWNDNEVTDARIQFVVTKDTTLVANFKEKEKVQIAGSLEIPTLKTERESAPIDLAGLFTTTEGGEVTYSAASSAPNVVAATVNDGKLFLTVYEYEGEAEITVTATLPNGEKNSVKATAEVILACNIQVEETITNVSCYGESDGEIALKVTNAAEPYTTLWTGATATTDTIKDVKAGNYEVVITDNENCSFTKTYTVSQPDEMKLSAKIKNPTCDNADGAITVTLTGAESAAFAWSNEATTQNVTNLEKGEYSLVVTNTGTGCQISDNFTLVEPEAPVVTVSNVVSTACNASNGAVTISVNEEDLIYNWSNNKHTKNLTNVPAGDYTLSVVNPETNCTATLEVTVPSIKLKQPEIALVTVSEQTGKNLVVWLKENTDLIQRYNIYRESETANVYTKIAEVPYSELSVYEDLDANPTVTAWRYKISATDVCNEETELGEYHKTIHLMQNQGLGGVYNLDWNTYEGLDFPTYVVIRKSVVRKVVTMDTIAYLSSNNNTYTDTLPAKGTQAYYVGMVLPEEINPMTQFMKAESGPFSIALSNIAEVESDGPDAIYDLSGSNAKAYAWGHTIYVKGAACEDVAVYDVNGRKIDAAEGQDEYEFQVRLDGVYFVKVGEYTFKVVVE